MEQATEQAKCKCGRPQYPVHCIKCGGVKIYGYSKKKVTRIIDITTGITKDFQVFRCERCGIKFDEFELLSNCTAQRVKTPNEKEQEELAFLRNKVMSCEMMSVYERTKFKRLMDGMSTTEFRRAVKLAESKGVTINEAREEEKEQEKKEEKPKEEKQSKFPRKKWKFSSGTLPPAHMIPVKQAEEKETKEQTNGDSNVDSSNSNDNSNNPSIVIGQDSTVITKKTRTVRDKDTVFQGNLTDEDLRNIPGVMEIVDD